MPLLGRPSEQDQRRESAYRHWLARQHPLGAVSLLLSVFSLTHFGTLWVDEAAGITLGLVALGQLARNRHAVASTPPGDKPPATEGRGLAWGGIVVGVASLSCAVVVYFGLRTAR